MGPLRECLPCARPALDLRDVFWATSPLGEEGRPAYVDGPRRNEPPGRYGLELWADLGSKGVGGDSYPVEGLSVASS